MTVLEKQAPVAPDPESLDLELPNEDSEPLESNWHCAAINLLLEVLDQSRPNRSNYFAGGNMFIYYSYEQARNWDYRAVCQMLCKSQISHWTKRDLHNLCDTADYKGPDFFVVLDVDGRHDRKSWVVWKEGGRYPNVIVELLSPSTAAYDKSGKKMLYMQTFHTPEYFCYDPDTQELLGWRLVGDTYLPLDPNEDARQ